MGANTPSKKPRTIAIVSRAKVRTGCRTCKIRRIKCGEERPACTRCVSTGRVCDGYGIWSRPLGGNRKGPCSSAVGLSTRVEAQLINNLPPTCLTRSKTVEEQGYLEWFKCCTAPKLPGAFPSEFWDYFLLQASSSEPAVLHAVLALGSAHKRRALYSGLESVDNPPDPHERFMLHHYNKAIMRLRPHLSSRNKMSARVALVTCLFFISLEFIRGNYMAGQTHLYSGLELLRQMEADSTGDENRATIVLNMKPQSIDDWIIDSFARLQSQGDYFGKRSRHLRFVLQNSPSSAETVQFQSAAHARRHLERLIDHILSLKEKYLNCNTFSLHEMNQNQRALQADLATWRKRCKALESIPAATPSYLEIFAYRLLNIYHASANILIATIHPSHSESIYDAHTTFFLSIINQAIEINKAVVTGRHLDTRPGAEPMSSSITDLGWIPPLFFTALKCRHHRVRMQATKLLSYSLQKDGIWDAKLALTLAREVVRIEEGDFYRDFGEVDDFHSPLEKLGEEDLWALPVLPERERWQDVDVVLPEAGKGRFMLVLRRRGQVVRREYNARFHCWMDGGEESTSRVD